MLYPRSSDVLEFTAPARSIEQALAYLVERLDAMPASHPDRPILSRQITDLEFHAYHTGATPSRGW